MTELTKTIDQSVKVIVDRDGKYLTFILAGEEYGISILTVKEIIGMMVITTLPQTPGYIKGIINLRGKVIPVMDLRLKFGLEEIDYTNRTCIIVVEFREDIGNVLMGIVVDEVSEVLNIKDADIEDKLNFGGNMNTDYILGMAKVANSVKVLLNIDKVISTQGVSALRYAA